MPILLYRCVLENEAIDALVHRPCKRGAAQRADNPSPHLIETVYLLPVAFNNNGQPEGARRKLFCASNAEPTTKNRVLSDRDADGFIFALKVRDL
jgi:hypothetical protein